MTGMGGAQVQLSAVIRDLQTMRATVVNTVNLHGTHAKDKIAALTRAGYGLTELGEAYRLIEQGQHDAATAMESVTAAIAKIEHARGS